MPTITTSLIPTVAAGSLFNQFTKTGSTYPVRWLTAVDPVYYEAFNRPHADITLRQLIIAKAVDNLQVRLGHQNLFPFITQPLVDLGGSVTVDVPISLIWDLHVSLAKKWKNIRLAKIKRISGTNPGTGTEYTGKLRLIFTGDQGGASAETALFMAEYQIDSTLSFQIVEVDAVPAGEESVAIGSGEAETIAGYVIFKTMDLTDATIQDFLDNIAPPIPGSEDSFGDYTSPAEYEILDNTAGGASIEEDFTFEVFSHGTGMLTASAINSIPSLDSDINTWINTFNYPFRSDATLITSTPGSISVPKGMFEEFILIAPDGDNPDGDTSGTFFPVYLSKIVREDSEADTITLYFATFNVSSAPSTSPIDFAKLELTRTNTAGEILPIEPVTTLFPLATGDSFQQGFGKGHVRLSTKWGVTGGEVEDFFDSLVPFVGDTVTFTLSSTAGAISPHGLSRVPKTIPTVGEAEALAGSTSSLLTPTHPSSANRYVVEADQGEGDQVDFADPDTGLPASLREHPKIDRYGSTGALCHRIVRLVVDSSDEEDDGLDYDRDILPRLRILLGRDPIFGDMWYDGTKFKIYNGDAWIV